MPGQDSKPRAKRQVVAAQRGHVLGMLENCKNVRNIDVKESDAYFAAESVGIERVAEVLEDFVHGNVERLYNSQY